MDALILSCGTGGGHHAAGHAVEEAWQRRGGSVRFINPYHLASPALEKTIDKSYIHLAVNVPQAFGTVYRIGDAYRRLPFRSPVYHANRTMAPILAAYLEENPVDVIFMPHLYPAEIVTQMKSLGVKLPKTVFIGTDYTCIPFTEETDCDAYVIPSPELIGEYTGRGVPEEKLHPLGIPVSSGFVHPMERDEACRELELDANRPQLLVLGGSIGAGAVEKTIEVLCGQALDAEPQVSVICGSNEALFHRLTTLWGERVNLIQRTNRVDRYMAACDVVIGKPGGLSSTETAVMGRPLIHTEPIPGCETLNRNFFVSRGMSLPVDDPARDLAPAVRTLLRPGAAAVMKEAQRLGLPENAAEAICDLAESLL